MASTIRKLDVYSIHGHTSAGTSSEANLNYSQFFRALRKSGLGTTVAVGDARVALVGTGRRQNRLAFRFVSGDPASISEAFDPQTGTTELVDLGRRRFLVSGAWVVVDPARRIAVVEKKRPGVPIFQLERFLSQFGRERGYKGLTVSLNLVPSRSFADEIRAFERIREASVTVRRPNNSFTSNARQMVGQIAAASNARDAALTLKADRGGSLAKDHGIVGDIVDFAESPVNPIHSASVTGTTPGVEREKTVHLHKHAIQADVRLETRDTPQEQLDAIDEKAAAVINALPGSEEIESRVQEAATARRLHLESRGDVADK